MRIGVLGWSQSEYRTRHENLAPAELVHGAVSGALEHAGVSIDEVDFVIGAGDDCLDGRSISNVFVAEAEGAFLREESKVEEDGAFALAYAWMRLAAPARHAPRVALVVGYSKPSESAPESSSALIADPFYQRPLGIDATVAAAIAADAYRRRNPESREASAAVAARNLAASAANPHAVRWAKLSPEQVLAAPRVAGPLGPWDLPATADGACAVVLATEDRPGPRRPLVWITGLGWATDGAYLGHRTLHELASAREAARRAYRMAEIRDPRSWFDVAELAPASSYHELMLYEALGFAEGGALASTPFSKTVMNPSGGTLGADPIMATGLARIAEASAQLAGLAADRQVPGARRALAHGACGLAMQSNIVTCLERGDTA